MHFEQSEIICPKCDHDFSDEDVHRASSDADVDLWDIAPCEERAQIKCPACDADFWVAGTYRPLYTTALTEDDL